MEYTVRTLALERKLLREILGLSTSGIDPRLTLNKKFKIFEDLDTSNFHPIKFFGVGIGSIRDGIVKKPNKKNLTLYDLVPIRINNKLDQFRENILENENNEEREKYRLRVALTNSNGDIEGYAYYLKAIEPKILSTRKEFEISGNIFTYSSNINQEKYIYGTGVNIIGEEFAKLPYYQDPEVNTIATCNITLNLGDIESVVKYYKDEKYNKINEIGIFSGSTSKTISNGVRYSEVYGCELMIHSTGKSNIIGTDNTSNIDIRLMI